MLKRLESPYGVGRQRGAGGRGLVDEEPDRAVAAGCENVGPRISVAVEHRNAAADEMLPSAGIDMRDGQGAGPVGKARLRRGRGRILDRPLR